MEEKTHLKTLKEILDVTGKDLFDLAVNVLEDEKNVEIWFNCENIALGGESPYTFCQNGRIQNVRDLLGQIEYGVYS